jgi:hypothetical protein
MSDPVTDPTMRSKQSAQMPLYPDPARQARLEGEVQVKVTTDGTSITKVTLSGAHNLLLQAAEQNVRTWACVVQTQAADIHSDLRLQAGIAGGLRLRESDRAAGTSKTCGNPYEDVDANALGVIGGCSWCNRLSTTIERNNLVHEAKRGSASALI